MQQTLFSLLTNEESRHATNILASLDQESVAGAPWFNEASSELPGQVTSS